MVDGVADEGVGGRVDLVSANSEGNDLTVFLQPVSGFGNEVQPDWTLGGENTTIGVVATNATLTKAQATKMAQMAQDGLARAVYPAHTPWDGDTIFSLATGEIGGEPNLIVIGAMAADVVAEAILNAVRAAEGLEGFPSASDLAGPR